MLRRKKTKSESDKSKNERKVARFVQEVQVMTKMWTGSVGECFCYDNGNLMDAILSTSSEMNACTCISKFEEKNQVLRKEKKDVMARWIAANDVTLEQVTRYSRISVSIVLIFWHAYI